MCHSPGCKGTNTNLFLVPGSHPEPQTSHVLPWAPRQRQVTRRTGDSPAPWCLPTSTSAPAMQPIPRMQTTMPMKCTALYRISRKNQESKITTGITKQSRSYGREGGKQQSGVQREAFHMMEMVGKMTSLCREDISPEAEFWGRPRSDAIKTDSETNDMNFT